LAKQNKLFCKTTGLICKMHKLTFMIL